MKIFLSYPSQDRAVVETVRFALAAQGHDVFFDREDLPPGDEYDIRIRTAIEQADLFIAFLSPDTFDAGSYTITEIEIAQRVWPHPKGHVLPVKIRPVDFAQIPTYLKSVTVLTPTGNVAASVADVVLQRSRQRRKTMLQWIRAAAALVIAAALTFYFIARNPNNASRDGAPMALVAAGDFDMGDGEWSPQRSVYVSAFYIDLFEVTTARYAAFLAATGATATPDFWDGLTLERDAELPVVGVTWQDADAYCRWADKRLPTEAEWERAARDTDRRRFPWGNDEPTTTHANFLNAADAPYPDGVHAVGKHAQGVSTVGTFDQSGNVSEWIADWFTDSFRRDDSRNPTGPPTGDKKVIRGGGWHEPAERITATRRFYLDPTTRADDVGFRCARDVK